MRNNGESDTESDFSVELSVEESQELQQNREVEIPPQLEQAPFQGDLDDYNLCSSESSVNGDEENNGNEERIEDQEHIRGNEHIRDEEDNEAGINPSSPVNSGNGNGNVTPPPPPSHASSGELYNDDDDAASTSSFEQEFAAFQKRVHMFYRPFDEKILVDPKLDSKMFKFYFMNRKQLQSSQDYYEREKKQLYADCAAKTRILETIATLKRANKRNIKIPLPKIPTRIKKRLGIKVDLERQRESIIDGGGLEKFLRRMDQLLQMPKRKNKTAEIKEEGEETAVGRRKRDFGCKPCSILLPRLHKRKSPTPSTSGTWKPPKRRIKEVVISSDEEEEVGIRRCPDSENTENEEAVAIPFGGSSTIQNILEGTQAIDCEDLEQSSGNRSTAPANEVGQSTSPQETNGVQERSTPVPERDDQMMRGIISSNESGDKNDDHPLSYTTKKLTTTASQGRSNLNVESAGLIYDQPVDYTTKKPTTTSSQRRSTLVTESSRLLESASTNTAEQDQDQNQTKKGRIPPEEKKEQPKPNQDDDDNDNCEQ